MVIETSEVGRRPYLDGVRGIAACMVFSAHLMIALFPSVITFTAAEGHAYWIEKAFGLSALSWLWNGLFAVCIFFVLSGYVLAWFCSNAAISFPAQVLRRYIRLALPMLITSFIAYLIMKLGLYNNLAASQATKSGWLSMWYRDFDPSLIGMAREALYDAFSQGRSVYNSNLWTMRIELLGSILVFLAYALFGNIWLRACFLLIFGWLNHNYFYCLFAAGALLHDFERMGATLFASAVPDAELREKMALFGFFFAIYLGAYPNLQPGMVATWHFFLPSGIYPMGWHMIGAVVLIGSLLLSNTAQAWLGNRFCAYLGRISFMLYLIHLPIICSVTAWGVYLLRKLPYGVNVLINLPISISVAFVAATLLHRLVDVNTTAFSRRAGRLLDQLLPARAGTTATTMPG